MGTKIPILVKGWGQGCHWHGKIGKIWKRVPKVVEARVQVFMDALQNICQILDEASRQLLRFMIKGLSD